MWEGDTKLNGASLYHAATYETYTREISTLRAWFKR